MRSMDQVHVGLGVGGDGPVQRLGGTPGLHGAAGARAALLRWLPNQSRGVGWVADGYPLVMSK